MTRASSMPPMPRIFILIVFPFLQNPFNLFRSWEMCKHHLQKTTSDPENNSLIWLWPVKYVLLLSRFLYLFMVIIRWYGAAAPPSTLPSQFYPHQKGAVATMLDVYFNFLTRNVRLRSITSLFHPAGNFQVKNFFNSFIGLHHNQYIAEGHRRDVIASSLLFFRSITAHSQNLDSRL